MKKCTKCGETLPLSKFSNNKRNKDGKSYRCVSCDYKKIVDWRKKNHEKYLHQRKTGSLRRLYGLTEEKYKEMVASGCSLCGDTDPSGNIPWHVDHCHRTGVVRGLLCRRCNTQLGSYESLISRIGTKKILEYILKSYDSVDQYPEP